MPYGNSQDCTDVCTCISKQATLKPRNWKTGPENWNPESTSQRKQVLQIRENYSAYTVAFACKKNNGPSKKDLKLNLFWKENFPVC